MSIEVIIDQVFLGLAIMDITEVIRAFYLLPIVIGIVICWAYRKISAGVLIMLISFGFELLTYGLWRLPSFCGWNPPYGYYIGMHLLAIISSGLLVTGLWITMAGVHRKLVYSHSKLALPTEE